MDCSSKGVGHIVDRLTLLPDELLNRILGMIPTKDAAALTLISNKEFMSAFSLLPNFEFDDSPISHCLASPNLVERTSLFKNFVDYVLRASQSKQLVSFTLRFGRFCRDGKRYLKFKSCIWKCGEQGECHPTLEPDRLNSWISFPLSRRVRELDLCIHVQGENHKLPRSIFVCETLEMLKLNSNLDIGVDDVKTFPIRLPRLKLLHLRTLIFTKDEFVTKLVDSCPVLEDLLLACCWECADVIAISSPSLLKLDLTLFKCYNIIIKPSSSVIIKTPNLQFFKYCDNFAQHYSISEMNALVQANIGNSFAAFGDTNDCPIVCSILKSCSTVSHLTLDGNAVQCLKSAELKNLLPIFHNLNHLELAFDVYPCTWSSSVLVGFLDRSPCLQTLVFPKGLAKFLIFGQIERDREQLETECQFWRTTQANPSCCKSHLKRIVFDKYHGVPMERALIQFLLKKALVLENLDISISEWARKLDSDPVSIRSAIHNMPRASRLCSITVS